MTRPDKPESSKKERGAFQKLNDGELMRTLIDLIPDMISVKDLDGKNVWVNRAKLNELGLRDFKDAIGKSVFELFDPAAAEGFERDNKQVLQTGQPIVDRREKTVQRDGSTRWLLATKLPWRDSDGNIIGLFTISRDITKRVEMELKLEQERNLLRTLIDHLPDAVYIKDAELRKVLVNPAELKFMGCKTEGEAVGKSDRDIYPPDMAAKFIADDQAIIQTDKPLINHEEKVTNRAGESRWILSSKIPWRDASGKIIGLIGIGRDVTHKKNLEAQIAQSQRMESMGRLATGVAHDLNNILAPILISIELLRKKLHDEEYLKMLAKAEANAHRGADIIKQMLWFGRGLAGQRLPVNLHQLVNEIAQFVSETFAKSIKVEKQIAPDLWPVIGDAAQLHQVLMNLVTNARDAMPNGGTLTIGARNSKADKQRFVILEVKDTGMGIAPELLDKIFEPFYTTKEIGHGLGLSTAQSIAKSHGGFIKAENQPGHGAAFRIHLPVQS